MNRIRLADQVVDAVLAHADRCFPDECCGLVASDGSGAIRFAYPLTNIDASPTSFTIAPEEAYGAFLHADTRGWAISGVFHSHPGGPDELSARDLDESADQRWLHLLVGPGGLGVYRVADGAAVPVETVAVSPLVGVKGRRPWSSV